MKQLNTLIFLLLLNLTALYGQTGINSQGDTIICYTTSEMRKIATKLVKANECSKLLFATEQEVKLQEDLIFYYKNMIVNLDTILIKQNKIISNNEVYIENLEKSLIKEKRKVKLFKSGFTISSIACSVLLILHLIN